MRFLLLSLLLLSLTGKILGEEPKANRKSGYEFMSPETRAMQDDDVTGPAVPALLDGEALWKKDCSGCHKAGMKGVAARYPAMHRGKLVNVEQRINACRVEQQGAAAFPLESRELLALSAYVGKQSRGLAIAVDSYSEAGRAFFYRRQGQLNLACFQCHDDNAGRKLAGATIPQAHPTGYPVYRLEWQGLGSLQRRLRNCLTGMRAESYDFGAPELVQLEQYLMWRARGMKLETPAVRP